MNDEKNALEALRRLAELKAKESGIDAKIARKGEVELKDLGVDPNTAMRSAALMKLMHDASQGRLGFAAGGFDVEAQMTPEEKRIKFGWKKGF